MVILDVTLLLLPCKFGHMTKALAMTVVSH